MEIQFGQEIKKDFSERMLIKEFKLKKRLWKQFQNSKFEEVLRFILFRFFFFFLNNEDLKSKI